MRSAQRAMMGVLLTAALGSAAYAQQRRPVFVKVSLGAAIGSLYDQPADKELETAQLIVDRISNWGSSPFFCWHYVAAKSAEPNRFPELRIRVQLKQPDHDCWVMQVTVSKGTTPEFPTDIDPQDVLPPGDLALWRIPTREQCPAQIRDWFLERFFKARGERSLIEAMKSRIPLGEGDVAPRATVPPLAAQQGLVYLRWNDSWPFSTSTFRIECRGGPVAPPRNILCEGIGRHATTNLAGAPLEGIIVAHHENPANVQGLGRGLVYLQHHDYITDRPDRPGGLIIADPR